MSTFHYPLGASSAHVWNKCPASPWLTMLTPYAENDDMLRGTRLHAVCAGEVPAETEYEQGLFARYRAAVGPGNFEDPLQAIHPLIGTKQDHTDYRHHADGTYDVHITDLKTGHVFVSAENNVQLKLCAALICQMLIDECSQETSVKRLPTRFHLSIYQEDVCDHPFRTWTVDTATVVTWIPEFLKAAEEASERGAEPVLGDHCQKCNGKASCAKYAASLDMQMPAVSTLTPFRLAEIAKKLKVLAAYKKAVDAAALSLAKAGRLPGAIMAKGRALPYVWLGQVPPAFMGPRTPAQIIKDKLATEDDLLKGGMIARPPSNPTLKWLDEPEDATPTKEDW